ncbi:MAG: hypothetical protein AAGA68_00280 [Pseudomonadota bacterium]
MIRSKQVWAFPPGSIAVLGCGPALALLAAVAPAQGVGAQAVERCDRAAALAPDDPRARHTLGVCYLLGEGRLTDHARALELFESASREGVREAAFSHAAALLFKVRQAQRFPEAAQALTDLANEGYGPAHFPLALAHIAALGVDESPDRGVAELSLAAREAHDEVAAWVLAVVYRYGLLGQAMDETLAWQYISRYVANLKRQYPQLRFSAVRLREGARTLHHDRLLRLYVFTDAQLELFHALAEEVSERADLETLRRSWN